MARRKRTYNPNLVKNTVSYTTAEIAELFNIHKGTVLFWLKDGLKTIDNKRPFYIHGSDLKEFLKDRQSRRKQKCKPDELFCLKCRMPKKPKKNNVILYGHTEKAGRLSGVCEDCGTRINKTISLKKLAEILRIFPNVQIRDKNIIGSGNPNVNTDL